MVISMKKIWKENAKLVLTIVISVVLASGVSYATVTMYASNTVSYDNTTSGLNSTNVQGALDEIYVAATDYTSIDSRLTTLENNYISNIYPVGSIYIGVNNTNPGTLFGGTWVSFGEGRTLVGVGTGTDSNSTSKTFAINETAGEYSHTLTIAEMPSHNHRMAGAGKAGSATTDYVTVRAAEYWANNYTSYTGGDQSHNNIQPYITVYMWKRTA